MIQAQWAIDFQAKITHGKMNAKKKYDEGADLMDESAGFPEMPDQSICYNGLRKSRSG